MGCMGYCAVVCVAALTLCAYTAAVWFPEAVRYEGAGAHNCTADVGLVRYRIHADEDGGGGAVQWIWDMPCHTILSDSAASDCASYRHASLGIGGLLVLAGVSILVGLLRACCSIHPAPFSLAAAFGALAIIAFLLTYNRIRVPPPLLLLDPDAEAEEPRIDTSGSNSLAGVRGPTIHFHVMFFVCCAGVLLNIVLSAQAAKLKANSRYLKI